MSISCTTAKKTHHKDCMGTGKMLESSESEAGSLLSRPVCLLRRATHQAIAGRGGGSGFPGPAPADCLWPQGQERRWCWPDTAAGEWRPLSMDLDHRSPSSGPQSPGDRKLFIISLQYKGDINWTEFPFLYNGFLARKCHLVGRLQIFQTPGQERVPRKLHDQVLLIFL